MVLLITQKERTHCFENKRNPGEAVLLGKPVQRDLNLLIDQYKPAGWYNRKADSRRKTDQEKI